MAVTPEEMQTTVLKPCPFCGSESLQWSKRCWINDQDPGGTIACRTMGCGASMWHPYKRELFRQWNLRREPKGGAVTLLIFTPEQIAEMYRDQA